ncbi:amidohydrolase family protein [Streptosporangium sp. NPDC006007]|uniref:metal-dependent hydrolase family protein n=1 Tax=Streptosporangium sp. NPDC006007 TaxID=3154575 RepID=UPI00339EB34C
MPRRFALAASQVVTGIDGQIIPDGAVIVRDDIVEWVGRREDLPSGLRPTMKLPHGTLLPGLVDAHVHVAFDAGSDPLGSMTKRSDDELVDLMVHNARTLLASGVTTVRDLGAPSALAFRVKALLAESGPRLVVAGSPLTSPRGHCWPMGGECETATDLSTAIRAQVKEGADWIKIMVTGGFMTNGSDPRLPQFSAELVAYAVAEADRFGVPVAAHAHSPEGIRIAAAAGVRTVEHCTWYEKGELRFDEETARLLAEKQIAVCPTLSAYSRREDGKVPWSDRRKHLTTMRDLGVPLIVGTDAGIRNTPVTSYVASLLPFLDLGMSNLDVIETATARTARALGLGAATGSIEPGKSADLLLVEGNPLNDLTCLNDVVSVITRGH